MKHFLNNNVAKSVFLWFPLRIFSNSASMSSDSGIRVLGFVSVISSRDLLTVI